MSESQRKLQVTDRRIHSSSSVPSAESGSDGLETPATPASATEQQPPKTLNVSVRSEPDPIDALVAKTFEFIVSQPEFLVLLSLPKPVRKKIGQDFGRMLTRVPHFGRYQGA